MQHLVINAASDVRRDPECFFQCGGASGDLIRARQPQVAHAFVTGNAPQLI